MTGNKKLGFGLMRLPLSNPKDPASIDIERTCRMVDYFIEQGFTYFDTAWMYCNYASEKAVKKVLCERHPRDSFTLATKLHAGYFNTIEDCEKIFCEQLQKTGAGYFDYYLLHDLSYDNYQKCSQIDVFSFVRAKKEEAMLKAERPDMSVVSWALRFAASLDGVMAVLSGMSTEEQVEENTKLFSGTEKLSEKEIKLLERAVEIFNSDPFIPCTGCSYCTDGCPMNIPIPKYFSLYNADRQEVKTKGWLPQQEYYDNLTRDHGAASECIECGQCNGICPQHLNVIKNLKEVADYFETQDD